MHPFVEAAIAAEAEAEAIFGVSDHRLKGRPNLTCVALLLVLSLKTEPCSSVPLLRRAFVIQTHDGLTAHQTGSMEEGFIAS